MAKLVDLDGLAYFYGKIKAMLAEKLGKNDTATNAAKVNGLTVETAVPKNAKFTDTIYEHPATHPASMITGLASIATSGSYNDLSDKPTIPSAYTLPTASNTILGGVKIGSNINVTDGTISLIKSNVTSALGYTPPVSDTVYNNATTSTAGLMSASDKVKLDSIAANANNYTHPATHPASMITGLANVATSGSYNDLADKPTIPASATVDSELSSTSVNPVQNKVINAALNNKAESSALSDYLPLAGGACTGSVSAPNFQTGTATTNYFQCRKFRGEGDANSYYHAVDFGYSGHDSVDFYEYDANWNFYQCTTGTKDGAVLVGNIDGNGWNGGAQLTGAPTAPTAAVGTNTTQIATTAFVANAISGMVKSVNGVQPDASGNVSITVSGGTNITVDSEFSETSTNPVQNRVLTKTFQSWAEEVQKKANTADLSTVATSGNYSDLSNRPAYVVQSVNNVRPDSNGNVTISTSSGDGVSLSTQNTWTAQQNFQRLKFDFEKYVTPRSSGAYDSPSKTMACYNATGAFTLNMSSLIAALDVGESTLFTAYITSSASYSLSITNAGTLKYVGSASDLAITASGLLLNILIVKESSGTITSIAQATKLA